MISRQTGKETGKEISRSRKPYRVNSDRALSLNSCPSRFRTWTLLIQNQGKTLNNYNNLTDLEGKSSIGAGLLRYQCRTMSYKTGKETGNDRCFHRCFNWRLGMRLEAQQALTTTVLEDKKFRELSSREINKKSDYDDSDRRGAYCQQQESPDHPGQYQPTCAANLDRSTEMALQQVRVLQV